jgi:hypothetical protein
MNSNDADVFWRTRVRAHAPPLLIGGLEFTRPDLAGLRGAAWTHHASSGDTLRLQPTRFDGERCADVVFADERGNHLHRSMLFSPTGEDLDAWVRRVRRELARDVVLRRDPLYVAVRELPAPLNGRAPLAWAVRTGDDPAWLQRAWNACRFPDIMLNLLDRFELADVDVDVRYESPPVGAFLNGLCVTRIRPPDARRHVPASAPLVRRLYPTLPPVADLIARANKSPLEPRP